MSDMRQHLDEAMLGVAKVVLDSPANEFASTPTTLYSGAEVARMLRSMRTNLVADLRATWGLPPDVEPDRPE